MEASKLELSISCTNLPKMDRFSKSDPMCVLYQSNERSGKRYWDKEDQTEVIKDSLDPTFAKTFLVEYHFEEQQHFKLILYDIDDDYHIDELYKQEYMGETEFCLAELLRSGSSLELPLMKEDSKVARARVHVQAEDVQDSNYTIIMQMYCTDLEKKDFFGKSDPYLEIGKMQGNGSFTLAHRTPVIHKNLNPRWPVFEISIQKLCSGDWKRRLKFTCYDWNKSGDPQLIGEAYATLKEICNEANPVRHLPLVNRDGKGKKKKQSTDERLCGTLHFGSVRAIPLDSFLDYIRGGCEITLMIAIDFTASNGAPTKPTSLHYNDRHLDNQYVVAIKSVASVLAAYGSSQKFPVFGFGAKSADFKGGVSHCFPLNGNPDSPEVDSVEGILDAYYYTLSKVELHGPTNFSQFLDKAIEMSTKKPVDQSHQQYYLLLVITDGVITDMANTVDRIVAASYQPMSIIIVGVGNANFAAMETLDADDTPLVDRNGRPMKRDIVQFLQLQNHQTLSGSFSLARETLAEIPNQFMSYMKMHSIRPNPPCPPRKSRESLAVENEMSRQQRLSPTSDRATAFNMLRHS